MVTIVEKQKFIVTRLSMSMIVAWEPNGTELRSGYAEAPPLLVNFDERIIAALFLRGFGSKLPNVCLACGKSVGGQQYGMMEKKFKAHVEKYHSEGS